MSAVMKMEVEQSVTWIECYSCGITFGMLQSWNDRLRREKRSFYCPNGHSQAYSGPNEADRLREQLAEEKRKRETAERSAEWERASARTARSMRTKAENKLKKITQRVNAGVCPHCNRTFKQLAAHMKSKHPDLAPASVETCNHDEVQA